MLVNMSAKTTAIPPDGGWGWFVVGGTFIVYALTSGSALAFGVLYVPLLEAFGETRAKTAFVGSISYVVTVLTNPYSSMLCDKIGHRAVVMCGGAISASSILASSFTTSLFQMYLTYGILAGIGNGFTHAPSVLIVSKYFDKRLPTATGIALAGSGFGMVLFSVVTQKLLDMYGWRGTLMVISAITLHLSLAGALYRPLRQHPTPIGEQATERLQSDEYSHERLSDKEIEVQNISLQRNPSICTKIGKGTQRFCTFMDQVYCFSLWTDLIFIIFQMCILLSFFAFGVMLSHMVKRAQEFGIPEFRAASLVAIVGVCQSAGRIVIGLVANMKRVNRLILYQASIVICAVCIITSMEIGHYVAQVILVAVFGFCFGAIVTMNTILCVQYFSVDRLKYTYSWIHIILGLGLFSGPPVGGLLRDITDSYKWSFYIAGVCCLAAVLIMTLVPLVQWRRRKMESLKKDVCVSL